MKKPRYAKCEYPWVLLLSKSFFFLRKIVCHWQRCEVEAFCNRAEVYLWRHRQEKIVWRGLASRRHFFSYGFLTTSLRSIWLSFGGRNYQTHVQNPHHANTPKIWRFDIWPEDVPKADLNLQILETLSKGLVESFGTSPRGARYDHWFSKQQGVASDPTPLQTFVDTKSQGGAILHAWTVHYVWNHNARNVCPFVISSYVSTYRSATVANMTGS